METSRLIKSLEKTLKLYGEIPPHEETETEESRVHTLFNKIKKTIELSENPKQIKTLKHFLTYIESHLNSRCLVIFKQIFPLPCLDEVSSTQIAPFSYQIPPADAFNPKITKVTHRKLEKLIRISGFIGDPEGVCDGIAKLALEGLIFERLNLFYENLENIALIFKKLEKSSKSLDRVKKDDLKIICNQILPNSYIKTKNFLSKIDLNYNDIEYKNILEHSQSFDQRIENICNLLGVYESLELSTLIKELQNLSINAENLLGFPLAFKLACDGHALTAKYDTENKNWFFIDSNELWTTKVSNLHEKIIFAFRSNFPILLAVSIFTKKLDISLPSIICNQLQKINNFSLETCKKNHNFISKNKTSLIYMACLNGHSNIIKLILDYKDIQVNEKDSDGISLLSLTCALDHLNIVKLLLAHRDIQVNKPDSNGVTPLLVACQNEHTDVVKELLSHKDIQVNQPESNEITPLSLSCALNHLNIIKLLLAHKDIQVNKPDSNGVTPLLIACENEYADVVKQLLSHKDIKINQSDSNGMTPLWIACQNGDLDIVNLLLAHNDIEINKPNANGVTPLSIACALGHLNIVKLLLAHKDIQVNQPDSNGIAPILIACQNNHLNIIKALIAHKEIEVNQSKFNKITPLLIACQNGNRDIVKELLSHKDIQINQTDSEGFTPLYIACQNNHLDVVKLLIDSKDIQINQPNSNQVTPLYIACENGYLDIVKLLLSKEEISLNNTTSEGFTPLYIACQNGYLDIVKLLLSKKEISINNTTSYHFSPLGIACYEGHTEIVKILLKNGVGISLSDEPKINPIAIAKKRGHEEIIKILESYKDPEAPLKKKMKKP